MNPDKSRPRYKLVDDELVAFWRSHPNEQSRWVILEEHPEFIGHWIVEGFNHDYFYDLRDVIGSYKAVAPSNLSSFFETCEEEKYHVAFFEDPAALLRDYERLNEPPPFALNSTLPDTIKGFLPFQVQGFNFLKDLDGGVAMWDTGCGKGTVASALIRYHRELEDFDSAWFVVKSHNKINVQRTLKGMVGLDSHVIKGKRERRQKLYHDLADADRPVIITNYEKFRVDLEEMMPFFDGRRVLCVLDEMPTRLSNRDTALYRSVCKLLYRTNAPAVNWSRKRPSSLRQYMLSATPIEQDPQDWLNCVRLLDPRVYGTVSEFESQYVSSYNYYDPEKPETWHELDRMGMVAAHITHQVNKDDPDIAKMFPEAMEEDRYLDWDEDDRTIYDRLTRDAEAAGLDDINPLALILVLQMLCDAPTIVGDSAALFDAYVTELEMYIDDGGDDLSEVARRGSEAALRLVEGLGEGLTNARHTKLLELEEILCRQYPTDKIVIFSRLSSTLMPVLEEHLRKWNVSYVRYAGTMREKQAAQDAFMTDPSIRVFLSSDAGSDSINLEVASLVIHYDQPWKWSTKTQRQNRVNRVTSQFKHNRYISLLMANSVEDRMVEIIKRKYAFHEGVFKGGIAAQAVSARMTREDFNYILFGR